MRSLLLWLVVVARGVAAAPLTVGEAMQRAVERGPESAASQAQIPVARAEVRIAGMLANPTLTVAYSGSEPRFAAAAQIRLPIFGQRGAHVSAAERGVDQASAEAGFALWRLRHDTRVAYYAAGRADDEVAIAVEVERLTGRVADMARERFEVGAGTRLEKEQAALLHVRALQDISDRRAAARVARVELGRLCGLDAAAIDALADPLATVGATPSFETLIGQAERRHPELRALESERVFAVARAAAGRADRRPLPTLEVGVELLEPATCNPSLISGAVGGRCLGPRAALSFDLPVLNWNGGPIARAEAEARAAVAKRVAARARVEAAVRSAWENFGAATVRAHFFDAEYLPAAALVEQMAREGFSSGKTGLLPLIESERAVLEARLGRTEALYAVQAARADLEEASGMLFDAP